MSTYDDIAGFDTSSLGLGAAALQGGQAGIDVANAAFANLSGAARYANAVALIEAAAGDGGVSPVRALLAFVDRLNQLDGDSSHFTAIGTEIAGLVASGSLDAAAAMADFLPAINAYQIGRSEAASIFIAVANAGALDVQLVAGCYYGQIITRGSFEGGEGGGTEGGEGGGGGWPGGTLSMTAAIQAIHNAVVGGSLGETQAYAMLAGLMVSPFPAAGFQAMNELKALIGSDTDARDDVIDIFIASVAILPFNVGSSAAGNIMSLVTPFVTPDLSLSELATHVHTAVTAGTLTAEQAIAMMVRFAPSYNNAIAAANDVATEVLSLVDDGFISQEAVLDALTGGSASTAARFLVAVASVDPDAAPAAGLHLATLIDTTTPTFMVPNNMMTAQQALSYINAGVLLGGLSGASAVALLTAMAFVPGGVTSDRNAMNAAADGVRGLLAGTIGGSDAAAAVVGALAPLGFTAEQGVTFLIALGASGFQQILGSSVVWVNNADLAAAASAAIAGLIHDHGLSAADIGAALSAVFPLGVDSAEFAVSTLIKAAPTLVALEPAAYTLIGAALAQADAVSAGLAMGQVNDRVRGHDIDAQAGIAIVAGFAAAGTVEDQVAAGRELNAIVYWTGLVAADGIAAIDAAVVAGTLTRGKAIVLLAGAATDSSPQGLADLLAQIAIYVDADAVSGVAALSAAVTAGALVGSQGLFVLAQLAALGSADTASAATAALLSWVDDGAITASDAATQLLTLADGAMALRAVAGTNIAAMVTHGALDAATATALVDAAVPATLDANIAIVVLSYMSAAGDTALHSAVLDEINALITGGDITLTNAIATLQALLPGASSALQAVVDEALAILLTDPATLAQTAGLGSPAQVQAAVNAIVLLFSTDPTAAHGVLDALSGRIQGGDLSSDQAATLLAKIYARGGDAADAAFDTIVDLTTGLDISVSTMANAIAVQVAAGALDAATAFVVFGELSAYGSINAAVAGLISGGGITVAALDAAVDAGHYSASNAIAVLGSVVPGAAPGLRAEALAEVQALVSETPPLASQALPIFMALAVSSDHALRLVGREGIEALAAAAPGVGSAAFLQLLSYMPVPDTAFLADTQAALNGLLAGGYLTAAEAVQHIDDQLSPSNASPLINAFQAVNILVALSAVDGARTAIYDYIRQEVAANSAAQAAGPSHPMWPFTAQPVIAALARGTVADLGHVEQTALVIVNISATLTTNQVVTSLGQGSTALIVLVAGFINRGMAEFGSYLAARVASLPLSEQIDSLHVISSLVGNTVDDLQLSDATELLLAIYASGAKAAALAELADLGAGVCFFIAAAMTSGSTTLANGVEVMAALATNGVPAFESAVAGFLGDMLVGSQFTPAAVMSALEAAVADDALTAQEMVALLQDVLVARLDPADLPATAALQSTILTEIDALIAAHHITFAEAVTAMASSASGQSGAMLLAIGGEIAAFVGSHAGSEAAAVAGILAASTGVITGAEALGLLVGEAIWGGADLQVAAGGGIAGLVAAGSVTSNGAAIGIYNAFLNSGLALSHLVAVTAGLWANGGIGVGAEVLYQVGSHGLATYADLAGQLATAVDAGTLSASEMIDGAVAVVLRANSTAAGADFVAALITHGVMAADDAVAELGASIAPTGLSAIDVVSIIAHVTADLPASAHLLGVGLAELAVAGQLSFSDVGTALSDALASLAVLSFAQASTLLIGAGTVAEVAAQAGAALIALIGGDAQRLADALDSIGDAIGDGTLTPVGGVALMVGIAEAGGQSQKLAVAEALDALVQAGVAAFGNVAGSLTSEVTAERMAGADAVFVLLHLVHDTTSAGQFVSFINYLLGQEALSAGDATSAVLAAVRDTVSVAPGAAVDLLINLAENHVQAPVDAVDRAVIVQAGAALASLVTGGEVTAASVLDQLAWPPFAVVPLLAAIEAAAGSQSSLGQGAHAALLTHVTGGFIYDVVQYVGQLIGPQGLTAAQSLSILVDIAVHGGVEGQIAVGQVLGRLLAEHAATTAELHAALYVEDLSNEAAAMTLAAMIDPLAATIPVAVLQLIVANVRLPQGADSWQPYVQPLIAALSSATLGEGPIYQANGLSLAQAVLAISAYARVGDTDVMHDAAVAIAALAQASHATDSVFALLSRALVSDPQYANLAGRQIAEVGVALGFTAEQTAEAVANSVDHGLTAADAINVLARLTSFDSSSFGLVSGAAIADLTDGHITSSQAMDVLLGLSGVSADNMMLLLAGFAGAGTAADQLAAGHAIAHLPAFDAQLLMQIPDNAVSMVALGIASSGAPNAEILLIALSLQSGQDLTPAMMAALAAAADAGTLPAADGVRALAYLGVNVANLQGDEALALRTALHEELVDLVRDHLSGDVAAGILLTSLPVTSFFVDKMRAEAGGMLAALVDAGLASAADITAALSASLAAGTNTPAAIAAFIAGAALNREYTNPFPTSHDLAKVLGDFLGELIETGSIGISDAMAGVAASQTWFRMGDFAGETTMLVAVAAHDAAGLQAAVGHALVAVYQSDSLSFMSVFDALVAVADGLAAGKAKDVLFGMADGFQGQPSGLGGLWAVTSEFAALNARGALTAQEVADGVTAEIAAGNFPTAYGLKFLAYWAAADVSLAGVAADEIGELMGTGVTAVQVIDALLDAPRPVNDDIYPDPPVVLAVARIIGGLGALDLVTYAHAANAIVAAEGHGTLATANAAAILLGLAETATDSDMAFLAIGFRDLIQRGLDPSEVGSILSWALELDLVTHVQASSFVAFAAWAISDRPDADLYMASFGSAVLAGTDPAAAVAAVDHVYELGLLAAEDVVSLLTYMHNTAGAHTRWVIGQELWKMFEDGGYALEDIFGQVVAHNSISWMQGSLIGAMAATDDASRQITVGHALGQFITDGGMSFGDAYAGLNLTGLSGEQYDMLILSVAGGSGPAVQVAIGEQRFGSVLAWIPAGGVDQGAVDLFDNAVAAGALTVPQLVAVLVGVGMAQYPGPYAVQTSIGALDALVTSGRITAEAAMMVVDSTLPAIDVSELMYWLAVASRTSSLHDAVAEEIVGLISDGALSAAQAFDYIREMIATPLDVADALAISGNTVANLYVSIAGHGDVALQDAAGAHLGALPGGPYLSPIDAAVTGGSLSAEGAVHVIASLLGALASDTSATARNWAVSHLGDYVSDGLVAVATVSSVLVTAAEHATTPGLTWLGAVMGGLDLDVAVIHDAIAGGDLTVGQGMRLLLGIGADGEGIDATFLAARAEIAALVTAGQVSAAQVIAEAATSSLDQEHLDALAFALVGHGTAADDAAIAAYFGAQATVFGDLVGRQDDSFFAGVVDEVGLVFAKVQGGQITVAQAIDAIEAYADEHGISSYAGVYSLNSLFSRYGNGAGVAATNLAMIDKIVIGDLSAELAVRVAEGTTSAYVRDPAGGTHVEAADATAITQQQAIDLLNWEATRAFLPENVDLVRFMFADDLWVARQVRIDSNPFTPFSMNAVIDAARIGNAYYNTGIQDVGRSAYAYDLALVALMEQVTAADRPADQQDYTIALNALSTRLLNGGAEGALVAQYAVGNLSFDQVLLALDKEVAATALGSSGADREMMHDISLAWLNLSARKYIAQNPGTEGAIEAGQLLQQLGDAQYSDDLLTGFGALLGLSSSGATAVISSLDRQEAYQAAFDTIRARTPATLPLNERDQAVLDVLIPMANGMQFVLERQPLGRALLTVGDDPTDAANYARLGAQVGVIFANKLAVDAMFAGTPWGAAITAAKFGAQVGLFVLSMGAVQDAIGEGPTLYLRGQLTIAGATASLLGDSLSDLGAAGAEIAISSAPHFIAFSDAVAHGDAQGIASSIGELAADYYMLQTGVDPRLYGAVGERFADLIVHLFTGDTGALGDDVRALGSAYLDTILKNPYLAAIGSRMVQYAETINGALHDINDSYRILGENVYTGLLLVGTRLDGAGNAIRDVAHKVGGFFTDILHGLGIDGYISGATVFADANFNGVLDPGEVSTTTDATGHYSITSNGAPLILQGGVDTATNLAFTGTMQAPAGSTVVTPLTTLIQKVAASTTGDPVAAQQLVASALGLNSSLDLNDLDTVAATRTGVSGATNAFAAASSILNTVSLLHAAGATDAFDALAARIVATSGLDLTDNATLMAIAASAGLTGGVANAVTQLALASNTLTEQAAASATDPMRFLRYVTAVSMAAQGDTAHDLAAAGSDAGQLANVLAEHTGAGLSTQVSGNRMQVGGFGDTGAGGGEVPLKISADGHGIELAPNGGVSVAGNWVRLAAQDVGSHAGSTVMVYTVDSSGNIIDHNDDHGGSALSGLPALGSVGGVEDDHGGSLLLGAQSVYLAAGEQLRFAVLSGNQVVDVTPNTQFTARGDGSLQVMVDGLHLTAVTNNSLSAATTLADAQRDMGDAFVFLKHGQTLSVELAGSSANVNTLGFVRIDVDAATGARSVAGVAFGDTAAFSAAVRSHMDGGLHEVHGGDFATTVSWTVSGNSGYYAPVLITPSGQTFVIGTANPGGHEQIRVFGENTFGFEDLAYNQGSDYDYNDMVMRLKPTSDHII
ncbi:DUF4114 domain-containing protein [Reyranella soli]|uniref:Uncharacterized protein n=1 Tax=Reyranella soli TaxID=1230389 RepID=A0A512N476_9HYPH|nr:DUF4114 domain-containing protein [Reyranella soli]GEP53785.1 hypothetical protein RSO01_09510 [Reyranella soli]